MRALSTFKANYAVVIKESESLENRRYELAGQNLEEDLKGILPLEHTACEKDDNPDDH